MSDVLIELLIKVHQYISFPCSEHFMVVLIIMIYVYSPRDSPYPQVKLSVWSIVVDLYM